MPKRIDLTGRQFEKLKVIEKGESRNQRVTWKCQCDCGKIVVVRGTDLIRGHTKSCGHTRQINNKKAYKHGGKKTRLYSIWHGMRTRTKNVNCKAYSDYGGRGIGICQEWDSFTVFRKWADENGYKDILNIDRMDNNKGYSPDNCRWVTQKVNDRNKRNNRVEEYNGERKTLAEFAENAGISYSTLKTRMRKGMNIQEALETPVKK